MTRSITQTDRLKTSNKADTWTHLTETYDSSRSPRPHHLAFPSWPLLNKLLILLIFYAMKHALARQVSVFLSVLFQS